MELGEAYRRHGHSVMRRAKMLLGHEQDAQEVLQEVFLSLAQDPGAFAGRASLSTFLYSVTTHRCLNRLRDARGRERILRERVKPLLREDEGSKSYAAVAVREVLAALPEEQAQAVVHYHLDGMSQQEIAEVMGCSRRHVGHLLERAQTHVDREERRAVSP